MNVLSLEKMEEIVAKNKNLSWSGWDVIESKLDTLAWMKPNARFDGENWYRINRYELTESGWTIPTRVGR